MPSPPDSPVSSGPRAPTVFLSYATEDRPAAQALRDALPTHGLEVWYDETDLAGGDAWDQKIRRQIRDCDYFMALISAHTEARHEGYFRREWRLACERSLDMADDHLFLMPVVLDDTPQFGARVPEKFLTVQWTRVPGGQPNAAFEALCRRLLLGDSRPASPRTAAGHHPPVGLIFNRPPEPAPAPPLGASTAAPFDAGSASPAAADAAGSGRAAPAGPADSWSTATPAPTRPGAAAAAAVPGAAPGGRPPPPRGAGMPPPAFAAAAQARAQGAGLRRPIPPFPEELPGQKARFVIEAIAWFIESAWILFQRLPKVLRVFGYIWAAILLLSSLDRCTDDHDTHLSHSQAKQLAALAAQFQGAKSPQELARLDTQISQAVGEDSSSSSTGGNSLPLLAIPFTAPADAPEAGKLADKTFVEVYGRLAVSHHGQTSLLAETLPAVDDATALARARAQHASFVLLGTVSGPGNDAHLTVRLLQVEKGSEVWSYSYPAAELDATAIANEVDEQMHEHD